MVGGMMTHRAGCVLTLKLMDDKFNWLSVCGRVGHLHFPRPRHHKVCGFVLWGAH